MNNILFSNFNFFVILVESIVTPLELPCDSCRIQTCNLLIRSQMLYSVELRSRSLFAVAKV